jgi:hypothetical protein
MIPLTFSIRRFNDDLSSDYTVICALQLRFLCGEDFLHLVTGERDGVVGSDICSVAYTDLTENPLDLIVIR